MQLVLIEGLTYKYFEGRENVHTIISDRALDAAYVEQIRTTARQMMPEIDAFDGNDPDGDLVA